MNSEVSIIGGGIVGTLIALKLSDSGYNITIYESNKKLGGVLKDIENDSGLFLNGCKTLNADTQHINNLLNIDSLNLQLPYFPNPYQEYYSLTTPNLLHLYCYYNLTTTTYFYHH